MMACEYGRDAPTRSSGRVAAMVLAHRTVHWTVALVLLAAAMLAAFAGCSSGSSSTSTSPSFRTIATFRGSTGRSETAHFITTGDWELYWTCDPTSYNGSMQVPFPLIIYVMNGGPRPVATPVDTGCVNWSLSVGNVDVHQSGEQWLTVVAGDPGGTWLVMVSVPQSDTGEQLVLRTPRTSMER
jgi:hypothetical protein